MAIEAVAYQHSNNINCINCHDAINEQDYKIYFCYNDTDTCSTCNKTLKEVFTALPSTHWIFEDIPADEMDANE